MSWAPRITRRPAILALGWLAGSLLILSATGLRQSVGIHGQPRLAIAPAAWEEGATPDCGIEEPNPDSAGQRHRHLAGLGVDRWHAAGYRGRGVKIALLDSGFRGYREFLGSVLPDRVTARSFRHEGNLEAKNSPHGMLCAEVLHALAPEAELLLANWEADSPERFLEAVRWARAQGAQVISCSVIVPSWSDAEGGGPVHEIMARLLGTGDKRGDVLFFASAGNMARRHWTGTYRDGGDGLHEWQPSVVGNQLRPWGSQRVSVELCWSAGDGFDLQVIDSFSGTAVACSSDRVKTGGRCAVARFLPQPGHWYSVQVRRTRAGGSGAFHLVALGSELEHSNMWGSVPFPGDGAEVLAVGAVDADGQRRSYSSCGADPRRPKPDLVAPVPFPSLCGARPFEGTSAAAPQAAALAALWWSRHPEWTASQIRLALKSSARDVGPVGPDCETGYGLVALPLRDLTISVSKRLVLSEAASSAANRPALAPFVVR